MLQPTQPGRLGTCALIAATMLATACAGDIEERSDVEVEQFRLGRVHVLLEPGDPDTGDDFEVTARFAYVRGMDEDFVRARIDMPELAADVLHPGDCIASDQLAPSEAEAGSTDEEELLLVDADGIDVGRVDTDTAVRFGPTFAQDAGRFEPTPWLAWVVDRRGRRGLYYAELESLE